MKPDCTKRYTYVAPEKINNYVKGLAHHNGISMSTLINVILHHIYNRKSISLNLDNYHRNRH